jgi:hypothetical protein
MEDQQNMSKAPRKMTGKHKQTEGYTPRMGMPASKKAGKASIAGKSLAKREKRLEGKPM